LIPVKAGRGFRRHPARIHGTGVAMKITQLFFGVAAVATVSAGFVSSASRAAEIDCSGTKKSVSAPFREVVRPGDHPKHELVLAVRTHAISSRFADLDGSELTAYALQDEYAGSGSQTGYFVYALKNGERIWARFESVSALKGSADAWEATYQGVFRFTGGTGRYAAIRGGGQYQGRVRPGTGFEESFACTMEY
jgi:hypothetical protein